VRSSSREPYILTAGSAQATSFRYEQGFGPAHLAERLADHVLFLDRSKILFYGTVGEMVRSSEPLVPEFLKDDQQEFHFPTKEKKKSPLAKNSKQER
jgi:hypothetical protein